MNGHSTMKRIGIIVVLILVILACNAPTGIDFGGSDSAAEQTRVAVGIQSTMLVMQLTRSAEGSSQQSVNPTPMQQQPQADVQPTYTPYPTYTVAPPDLPTLQPLPLEPTVPNAQDIKERMKNARILVYDESYGRTDHFGRYLVSRISDALTGLGLKGGNVVNVRDAMGDFMSELNSPTKWDLIIVGAEARWAIRGEFWDVIGDQIRDNNVAVAAEVWYLDDIGAGRIAPVLSGCGIAYEKNWERVAGAYNLNDFLVYILEPDSPFFSNPNTIGMLIPTSEFAWLGDVGDRVKVVTPGKGTLLAGSSPREHSRGGLITSCYEGRVIFQTFSTHDYKTNDMISLWQNYIVNTLTNRFMVVP